MTTYTKNVDFNPTSGTQTQNVTTADTIRVNAGGGGAGWSNIFQTGPTNCSVTVVTNASGGGTEVADITFSSSSAGSYSVTFSQADGKLNQYDILFTGTVTVAGPGTPTNFTVTDAVGNGGTYTSTTSTTMNLSADAAPSGQVLEFSNDNSNWTTSTSFTHNSNTQVTYYARYRDTSTSQSGTSATVIRRVADLSVSISPVTTVAASAPTGETTIATLSGTSALNQYRVRATGNINGSSVTDQVITGPTATGSSLTLTADNPTEVPAATQSATYTLNVRVATGNNGDGFYRNFATSVANRSWTLTKSVVYGGQAPPENRNHGRSEWIAMTNTTVAYGTNEGTTVIKTKVPPNGTESTVVTTGSNPAQGTFSITAGNVYFADKPFTLVRSGLNSAIVPTSLKGREFGDIHSRGGTATYYFWSDVATNVAVYDNVSGGLSGTPTSTFSMNANTVTTFSRTAQNTNPILFASDQDMVMSKAGATNDRHVMAPASEYMYYRRGQYVKAMDGLDSSNSTGSSTVGGVGYDSNGDRVYAVGIGDGAGGDSEQGLGFDNLSENYLWPYPVRDFVITSPNICTVVVESFNSGNWVERASYNFNGTTQSPETLRRDGDSGFTTAGTNFTGTAATFNSDVLWRFSGTDFFHLALNDNSQDEESAFGFMDSTTAGGGATVNVSYTPGDEPLEPDFISVTTSTGGTTVELTGGDEVIFNYFEFGQLGPSSVDVYSFQAANWDATGTFTLSNSNSSFTRTWDTGQSPGDSTTLTFDGADGSSSAQITFVEAYNAPDRTVTYDKSINIGESDTDTGTKINIVNRSLSTNSANTVYEIRDEGPTSTLRGSRTGPGTITVSSGLPTFIGFPETYYVYCRLPTASGGSNDLISVLNTDDTNTLSITRGEAQGANGPVLTDYGIAIYDGGSPTNSLVSAFQEGHTVLRRIFVGSVTSSTTADVLLETNILGMSFDNCVIQVVGESTGTGSGGYEYSLNQSVGFDGTQIRLARTPYSARTVQINVMQFAGATLVPNQTFSLDSTAPDVIDEGGSGVFEISTTNVPDGNSYYWDVVPYEDFRDDNAVSGERDPVPVTPTPSVSISTAEKKFGASSIRFITGEGLRDSLQIPSTFVTPTGDWTFECWIYQVTNNDDAVILSYGASGFNSTGNWPGLYINAGKLRLVYNGSYVTTSTDSIAINTWYHVAVSYSGTTFRTFINGVYQASYTNANGVNAPTDTILMGYNPVNGFAQYNGYVDEVRISDKARYPTATDFTVQTRPFMNDDNTLVLLHGDGSNGSEFMQDDNGGPAGSSSSGRDEVVVSTQNSLTVSTTQAKFGGASALFNNGQDAFLIPASDVVTGTNPFTWEAWIYKTATSDVTLMSTATSGSGTSTNWVGLYVIQDTADNNTPKLRIIYRGSYRTNGPDEFTLNVWNHVALSFDGSVFRAYLNGVAQGTYTNSAGVNADGTNVTLGYNPINTFARYRGHMDEIRFSSVARYTSAFTPPTSAFLNDAQTTCLIHCNGANLSTSFNDDNGNKNLRNLQPVEVFGTMAFSNVARFGKSSGDFGTGSGYLRVLRDLEIGTGDFTFECFWRTTDTGQNQCLFDTRDTGGTNGQYPVILYREATNDLNFYYNTGNQIVWNNSAILANTWYHVALTRSSGVWRLFVDGVQDGGNYTAAAAVIATDSYLIGRNINDSFTLHGYIDEVRVSNTARYTANFSAPTTPFVSDSNTDFLCHFSDGVELTDYQDSVVVVNNAGLIPLNPIRRLGSQGHGVAKFQVRLSKTGYLIGEKVFTTKQTNFTTAAATQALTVSADDVREGELCNVTVNWSKSGTGTTTRYWRATPIAEFLDFKGTVDCTGRDGTVTFGIRPFFDGVAEGTETATISIYSDEANTNLLASDTFSIRDNLSVNATDSYGVVIKNEFGDVVLDDLASTYAVREVVALNDASVNFYTGEFADYAYVTLTPGRYPTSAGIPIPAIAYTNTSELAVLFPPRIGGVSNNAYTTVYITLQKGATLSDYKLAILSERDSENPSYYNGVATDYGLQLYDDSVTPQVVFDSSWRQAIVNNVIPINGFTLGTTQNGDYDVTSGADGVLEPVIQGGSTAESPYFIQANGSAFTVDGLNSMDPPNTFLLGGYSSGYVQYFSQPWYIDGQSQGSEGGGQFFPALSITGNTKVSVQMFKTADGQGAPTANDYGQRDPDSWHADGCFVLARIT